MGATTRLAYGTATVADGGVRGAPVWGHRCSDTLSYTPAGRAVQTRRATAAGRVVATNAAEAPVGGVAGTRGDEPMAAVS